MITRMVVKSAVRSARHEPRRGPTPKQLDRRRQIWSVVIILALLAWLLWYHH